VSYYPEFLGILAIAAGQSPRDPVTDFSKARVYVIPPPLAGCRSARGVRRTHDAGGPPKRSNGPVGPSFARVKNVRGSGDGSGSDAPFPPPRSLRGAVLCVVVHCRTLAARRNTSRGRPSKSACRRIGSTANREAVAIQGARPSVRMVDRPPGRPEPEPEAA
jgi:hypothetical protein